MSGSRAATHRKPPATPGAESDEVLLGIVSGLIEYPGVVDLQIVRTPTSKALPSVRLRRPLDEACGGIRV